MLWAIIKRAYLELASNFALVCPYDHGLITTENYTVRLGNTGHVEWTAPTYLDPTRTPHTKPEPDESHRQQGGPRLVAAVSTAEPRTAVAAAPQGCARRVPVPRTAGLVSAVGVPASRAACRPVLCLRGYPGRGPPRGLGWGRRRR